MTLCVNFNLNRAINLNRSIKTFSMTRSSLKSALNSAIATKAEKKNEKEKPRHSNQIKISNRPRSSINIDTKL